MRSIWSSRSGVVTPVSAWLSRIGFVLVKEFVSAAVVVEGDSGGESGGVISGFLLV